MTNEMSFVSKHVFPFVVVGQNKCHLLQNMYFHLLLCCSNFWDSFSNK